MTLIPSLRMLLLAAAVGLSGCAPSAEDLAAGQAHDEAAFGLVAQRNLGKGLRELAIEAAHGTYVYTGVVRDLGQAEADLRIQREIDRALPTYQPRWDRALAGIYARQFTTEELTALAAQGSSSPHAAKFQSLQTQVAEQMKAKASPVLEALVTDAMVKVTADPADAAQGAN